MSPEHREGFPSNHEFEQREHPADVEFNLLLLEAMLPDSRDTFEAITNTSLETLMSRDREDTYRAIEAQFNKDNVNPEFYVRSRLHVATEGVKGVNSGLFNEQPYRYDENTDEEISERIKKAAYILDETAYNNVPISRHVLAESYRLATELQKAVSQKGYQEAVSYTGAPGPAHLYSEYLRGDEERLVVIAETCLDKLSDLKPEELTKLIGEEPLHRHYMRQLECLPKANPQSEEQAVKSEHGDDLIVKAMGSIDGSCEEAVNDLLWMIDQTKDNSIKNKILDKAVEVTEMFKAPHHEGSLEETKPSLKDRVRGDITKPRTIYERRVYTLVNNLSDNFEEILLSHPKHVGEIVELHNPEDQEMIWRGFAARTMDLCREKAESFKEISEIQAAFKQICKSHDALTVLMRQISEHLHPYFPES